MEVLSSAVSFGTIQLLPDGQLIVLMADHQTTGGYPKVATVIAPDAARATQLRPGDTIQFVAVDPSDAVHVARAAASRQTIELSRIADRPGLVGQRLLGTNLIGGVFHEQATEPLSPL